MLAAYPLMHTRSTEEVVALIESVAGLALRKVGTDAPGETAVNGLWLRRLSFSNFRYGFEASIAPADDLSTYILSIPLCGSIRVTDGHDRRSIVRPGMGVILSPGAPLAFDYPQGLQRILMRISVEALSRHFALLTGKAPAAPLRFDAVLGPDQAAFAALKRHILVTISRIDAGIIGPTPNDASEEIESAILSTVIHTLAHDHWHELAAPMPAPSPRSVRRVVDYIHANAHQPIALEELVLVSGVAGRTLFKHFRAFKGVGPMAYLRRVRMERVRDALAAAGPADTVTEIALKWGFHELGRFAGSYRRIYGEPPSATLRRLRKG